MLDSVHRPRHQQFFSTQKRKWRLRLWFGGLTLLLLSAGIFAGSKLVTLADRILEGSDNDFSFRELFLAGDKKLIGEEAGQVRILLMGIGGERHEGGTLTDTMILATIKLPEAGDDVQVGLISIPRDLTVYIPGYEYRKINSAYAYGGAQLATEAAEGFLGQPVPYFAVIDFQGFKKIIDELDGIKINVEQGFTDSQFPDERFGFLPPIRFEAGLQKMEGSRALEYVRSRHGSAGQGSDFARARRQQQVLKAIRDEVKSIRVLTNLNLLNRLFEELSENFRTNLKPHEIKRLYTLVKDIPDEDIITSVIGEEEGLVCSEIVEENGAFILVPCEGLGNYGKIRSFLKNQFVRGPLEKEQAKIEIQNATTIDFLGQQVQGFLGIPSTRVSTANFRGGASYPESVIYDNTGGTKKNTLAYLRERLGIRLAGSPFPFPTAGQNPDFVIVISHDIQEKIK